ncbi:MAG: hypothetical protein U9N02_01745 [Campylobacterota bacterium]|nr:hypothetical protein [Campylobacterota bacterium]
MQKILKWFTPVLTLGVAIFIIYFLISINSNDGFSDVKPLVRKTEEPTAQKEKLWLDRFSITQREGYFYPVNEVYVKVDLNEKILTKTIYKLSASSLDPYQLFCLKEELKQHKLRYYFTKDKSGLELLIYSTNKIKLNSLVRVLKKYQISAKVMPYKEDT